MAKQRPITCSGHTRPVTDLEFSKIHLISACKGKIFKFYIQGTYFFFI